MGIERDAIKLLMGKLAANVDDDRRALFILHLGTITALIDAGVLTADRTIEQIIRVQAALPAKYRGPRVNRQLETAIRFLSDYGMAAVPGGGEGDDEMLLCGPGGLVVASDDPAEPTR